MEENRDISDSDSSSAPPTRFEDEELELTTTTDPKKRRQIQNRIAQRVYRACPTVCPGGGGLPTLSFPSRSSPLLTPNPAS